MTTSPLTLWNITARSQVVENIYIQLHTEWLLCGRGKQNIRHGFKPACMYDKLAVVSHTQSYVLVYEPTVAVHIHFNARCKVSIIVTRESRPANNMAE
jgi:hypothetical protein